MPPLALTPPADPDQVRLSAAWVGLAVALGAGGLWACLPRPRGRRVAFGAACVGALAVPTLLVGLVLSVTDTMSSAQGVLVGVAVLAALLAPPLLVRPFSRAAAPAEVAA